ncbi:MAG: hypothetical protein ACOY5B_13210 [Spirochaetota bacterium]
MARDLLSRRPAACAEELPSLTINVGGWIFYLMNFGKKALHFFQIWQKKTQGFSLVADRVQAIVCG